MRPVRAVLPVGILAVWLIACRPVEQPAIYIGLASEPLNLDPRFATDATSERLNRLLYRRLVDFNDSLQPVPALASWDIVGPAHFRFTLRPGRGDFHDGTALDAADVAATYRSILDPATRSPHRKTLSLIRDIRVIDRDTLDFILTRHDILFPAYLGIGIVPEEIVRTGRSLAKRAVGSGPFRFRGWSQPGRLELTRISDAQTLVFERVSDPTMRVLKLLRGEIDMLQGDLPPELLDYVSGRDGIRVLRRPGSNFSYLGFNLEDPATRDPRVRKAIALAIDRDAIIQYIFAGAARAASALLPPSHWAGAKHLPAFHQDRDVARALLQRAGYDARHPLQLEYKTSSDPFRIRIASVFQQQLAEVGVRVRVSSYDWGTFYGDIKAGRFQLFSLTWVGVKTPDIFRYVFHSGSLPPGGANRGHLDDARIDGLIEAAEHSASMQAKARLYRQIQARLLELLPYVPLWYEDQFAVLRDTLSGYQLAADGNFDALANTLKSRSMENAQQTLASRY